MYMSVFIYGFMNMGVVSTESRRRCWFPGAGVKGSYKPLTSPGAGI